MKARHKRSAIIGLGLVGGGIVMYLVYIALESNLFYFMSPTDVKEKHVAANQAFRLGGMVVKGSLQKIEDGMTVQFNVTDNANTMPVRYRGILPDLFKEGSGVVAEGRLNENGVFVAKEVLAKHDEDYMPPDVKRALDKGAAQAANNPNVGKQDL